MYDGTEVNGYIGGSAFERIPAEQAILKITESFKTTSDISYDSLVKKMISGINTHDAYIYFIKKYISLHYHYLIHLKELPHIMNLARSYLSRLFKEKMFISFQDYLIEFRMNRAMDIMDKKEIPLKNVADMVGYPDYPQFSKV